MRIDETILAAMASEPRLAVDLATLTGAHVSVIGRALARLRSARRIELVGEVRRAGSTNPSYLWGLATGGAALGDFSLVDSATGRRHVDVFFDSEERADAMRRQLLKGLEDTEWNIRLVVRKRGEAIDPRREAARLRKQRSRAKGRAA